jgi:hypothetical protein
MTEPTKAPEFTHVERLLDAPVVYCDAVPTIGLRGPIVSVTLAVTVGELVSKTNSESHLRAVADVRMPLAAAVQLRDSINKVLLAVVPTPGAAN